MKLSARNQLVGKVIEIKEGAVNASVTVDIGGGNIIKSTISLEAVKDLELKIGSDVTAIIKATSVLLGV
ncbi:MULTISPECIES: TOBE domain-containing protein [Clostridium]|uniref:Molybdenum-pterin binding domain-containing protein n=1 Tax=Clostridium intestinale DSM 6191 TaxID=1121320 RepID=A0A1M6E2H6_9CLOT|nr:MULTISPECIES: TOBE domain-containing protein [Clostridium]SHI79595.1 molybdenum-pterin binding domain-containing protein [Clostridium intestinale DSM 6191]